MSEPGPLGGGGPLEDLLRNLARLLTSQGPVNWEIGRQLAQWTATEGESEDNPDPVARVRLEELLRVADLHVTEATGLATSATGGLLSVRAVTRSDWALRTIDAWRPLLESLATSLGRMPEADELPDESSNDPMAKLLGNLPQAVAPLLFGMQAGAMVGHLATRAMGQYDLPLPRPRSDELLFVPRTIDTFAADWSLPIDDVRLWVCLHEIAHHAVLSRPHVRARLEELLAAYAASFEPSSSAIEERLGGFDPTDLAALQETFSNPEVLLGEFESPAQRELKVPLQALLSAVAGYVDHVMDTVGKRIIGAYGPLTEALRRRRLEEDEGTRFVSRLLGIELDAGVYERGAAFVKGVLERAGEEGLSRLWKSSKELPTPAEINAPGLWLARIDLPDS
ncbi:MAG TPA: zinc-dependent metalloprotease [Acidimicrobiales bacterium]|nr:zinc-dependent metalloprotease [Acidimicrobiales bacterium]